MCGQGGKGGVCVYRVVRGRVCVQGGKGDCVCICGHWVLGGCSNLYSESLGEEERRNATVTPFSAYNEHIVKVKI